MNINEKPKLKELPFAIIVTEPGASEYYKTGDWKTLRPVVDKSKCIKCANCYIFCPDSAFEEDKDGYFNPNYDYCKGCGICVIECPANCIGLVEEETE